MPPRSSSVCPTPSAEQDEDAPMSRPAPPATEPAIETTTEDPKSELVAPLTMKKIPSKMTTTVKKKKMKKKRRKMHRQASNPRTAGYAPNVIPTTLKCCTGGTIGPG